MHVVRDVGRSWEESDEKLAHERLDVYAVALEFLELAEPLLRKLPRTKGQLGDQLARASESIVLRIAEGAGAEWRSADQKRYFRNARGSALECSSILDVCKIRRVGTPDELDQGRRLLVRLVQMLTRLTKQG
jgi:four helix bundle protein